MRTGGASWLMPFIVLSYHCTVLLTTAFYFLPYTMRSTLTRSSHGSDRQSGRGSLPHLASLPIPSLGAGRPAVLLAPSTTLATTAVAAGPLSRVAGNVGTGVVGRGG